MASSSKELVTKVNLLGKRKPEDGLETKPFLKRHKEIIGSLELSETKSDEADLISLKETKPFLRKLEEKETESDDSNLISVKETVEELDETPDFAEEAKKTLFIANLSSRTEISDVIDFFKDVADVVSVRLTRNHKGNHMGYGFVEFASANEANKALEKKNGEYLHYCKIILDETPDFAEEPAVPNKTVFIAHFSRHTIEISDIIDFFKDVGQVVRVRLTLNRKGKPSGCGLVEFASANEAKKALQKKNGEYLRDRKISLDVLRGATFLPPKYCIDHKIWYEENYLQRESLPLEEEAAVEGLDGTPDSAEEVLLVANLSPQTTKIVQIIDFFKDVGTVVCVRLIVNHEGKHVGYGFVEFASPNEAKKALEEKNGEYLHDHKILLMKGVDETTPALVEEHAVTEKTVFVARLPRQTVISDIIGFFKDVGEVVHVRLNVDVRGKHVGSGFVEFASAEEAKKAVENKNGECLHNSEIFVTVFWKPPYHQRPKYCIDHKVWYEDYIRQESHVAAVEGFDETPDFAEEVALKKTVFVDNLSYNIRMSDIINIFKDAREIMRVRVIVDHRGEHVGCCFVELATADAAKKAVQENRSKFSIKAAEMASPYPFRPKYNLADLAEKLWYEDNLRRKSLCGKKTKPKLKKQKVIFCGKKKTFSDEDLQKNMKLFGVL